MIAQRPPQQQNGRRHSRRQVMPKIKPVARVKRIDSAHLADFEEEAEA